MKHPLNSGRARATLAGRTAAAAVSLTLLLGSGIVAISRGDVRSQISASQSQISSSQSAARALRSQIAAESGQIANTGTGVAAARAQLGALQAQLLDRIAELRTVQTKLIDARANLVDLENRLQQASVALASNLRAAYEHSQPDLMTVILNSHGFSSLLERVTFIQRIGREDAAIVSFTRVSRREVLRETVRLGTLEERDRTLTDDILAQRNKVAALQGALVQQQISELATRSGEQSKLGAVRDRIGALNSRLGALRAKLAAIEARAAAQAAQTALEVNRTVGGIAIDTAGMVQPPAGAPPAVSEMIAAGNAIATLPYIWGGGHGSFQAAGYDCSGSTSYVLAAAGLLSAPMVSGDFESYGDPGPGQWVTIYANAGHVWMQIGGWRFDTVALSEGGTRWSQGGGEYSGFVVRHPPGL
jgi:peptidoglycan hydrolase CwlO-like protein